jgi:monoterpene epsilon-lactone hydrolase
MLTLWRAWRSTVSQVVKPQTRSRTPSARFLRLVEVLGARSITTGLPLEQMRADFEAGAAGVQSPEDVVQRRVQVNGLRADWFEPAKPDSGRVILHLHGGGCVLGSPDSARSLAAGIAKVTNSPVLALDYRLAPEHPCPAALFDVADTYTWLLDNGHAPSSIALVGDSGGGNLTVAGLVEIVARGLPVPAGAVVLSGMLDLTFTAASIEANSATDPQTNRATLEEFARLYLGSRDPRDPQASPVFADLRGLPPLLLLAGGGECLLDDSVALAHAARSVGVDVTLEVWEHMIHNWLTFAPRLPEAVEGLERVAAWLQERWP